MADLTTKKFLDYAGTTHLWEKIQTELNKKGQVDSVTAGDNSIAVSGTAVNPTLAVKISAVAGNDLELKSDGLYVEVPAAADYTITKLTAASAGASASYQLTKDGTGVGAVIDIPKDMVVSSGAVVTNPTGQPAGTYIELTLANATNDKLYINVGDLIEYVTSGSQTGDMVVVNVDANNHQVTATITDGTVTKAKLASAVQTSLNLADSALQKADITTGGANGTISVDGDDVAVKGLGSAAYAATTDFDAAGAADAVYAAVVALSNADIDAAIAAANV